ncbi:DUF305 domain-containing protein [Micromonospora tarapacensis]|uniref:DUF305 domain-containing protein n=1 Tax=Micromonospora tarapacensis TaxID=2835305 RepID=UPI0038B2357A
MAQRLLPVLDLVPTRTTDPAWRRLAARVEATHRADLVRSSRLLGDSGAPATNPHDGHDMPGMVTDEELATLRSAAGETFHRLVAGHLRAHLTQSVRIAAAASRSGIHPATTTLAAAVVRGGTAQLARLDRLDRPPAAVPGRAPPSPPPGPESGQSTVCRRRPTPPPQGGRRTTYPGLRWSSRRRGAYGVGTPADRRRAATTADA